MHTDSYRARLQPEADFRWNKARRRPAIGQRSIVPSKMGTYGQVVKSKKPAAIKSSSPVSKTKPSRAEIRREEPRRTAPRATGNAPERGNQSRSHKSGKK
jgi:hypothetical protein